MRQSTAEWNAAREACAAARAEMEEEDDAAETTEIKAETRASRGTHLALLRAEQQRAEMEPRDWDTEPPKGMQHP